MCRWAADGRVVPMSEPVRILLRVVGLVLFFGSLAGVVYIIGTGPNEVGIQMGRECRHNNQLGPSEWCTWQDVLGILKALPVLTLVGGVLVLISRRDSVEEKVRSGRVSRLRTVGMLAAVLIIPLNFVGTWVYSAAWTVDHQVGMTKKILDKAPGLPEAPGNAKRKQQEQPAAGAPAPRGLDRGSLLEEDAFRAAMAQVRRVAPAGARISALRVAADRVNAEVLAGRRVLEISKPWDSKARIVSRGAATDGDEALITFGELDAAAPQRATMAGARSAGVTVREVDYLVLFEAVGLRWNGFLVDGKGLFSTSPDGRTLR